MLIVSGHPVAFRLDHVIVEDELLLNVSCVGNRSVVDIDAEGAISTFDCSKTVAESELSDETARPGFFFKAFWSH